MIQRTQVRRGSKSESELPDLRAGCSAAGVYDDVQEDTLKKLQKVKRNELRLLSLPCPIFFLLLGSARFLH